MSGLEQMQREAVQRLLPLTPILQLIGETFAAQGHQISLVGGPVRDALLGRLGPHTDLDFATDARPEQTLQILDRIATSTWEVGIRFGTVGARVNGRDCEITTYRTESYDPDSRKPNVDFGDSLEGDLGRRDFTVNAMALRLPELVIVDPFNGLADLGERLLRTPGSAVMSFTDDPLRILRAARFVAQLGFAPDLDVMQAMQTEAHRLSIISAERIRDELSKLLLAPDPRSALDLLVVTGVAEEVLPELPMLQLEVDEHHRHKDVYEHSLTVLEQCITLEHEHEPHCEPDLTLRLAALLHDIGKPKTRRFEGDGRVSFHHHEVVGARMVRKRLTALHFPNDMVDEVSRLVELHLRFHGYGSGEWTDSAVRRYVRDAGDLLVRLHKLTRADCTTRNRQRALRLQRTYDDLERRIERLAQEEELAAIRPDLDGREIMEILQIPAGPAVGEAYRYLMEVRLDSGPIGKDRASEVLLNWWRERSASETTQ
jgi:poly(A) polymerase